MTVRERAWEPQLRRILASAAAGTPALGLVEGQAGMGKTHLVRWLLGLPELHRVPRLAVTFSPAGTPVVLDTAGSEGFAPAASAAGAASSGRHRPQVDPQSPHFPPPATVPYHGLEMLLEADEPTLLVAEDVHRADGPTRALLQRLLARPPARLGTVLTYRPEELGTPGLPLGAAVDYPSKLAVVRVRLEPLDADEVRFCAAAVFGEQRCSAEFAARLHERSGGVARVVADLLGALDDGRERERYTARDVDTAPVPVRLTELVLDRMVALTHEQRRIVWAAAVLDEAVDARELTGVAGLPADSGREALLAALDAAALHECGDGRYGFQAPMAAAAVYEVLPGPIRQELHRRAAQVLARRQPVPWTRLAHHRRSCGQARGWLRSVERAARGAAQAGDHQAAISLLEETLADALLPQAARPRLALLLARSAVVGLRSDQTVEVLRRIVDDKVLPTELRGEIRLDLGLLLSNQVGRGGEGRAELERAVDELQGRPALAARAMSALAMPYWPGGSLAENLAWLERAEVAAAESGDPVVRAAVAANRAAALMSAGDPAAWALVEQLPRDNSELACRLHVARGLCNTADAAVWLGHYQRAAGLLAEGLEQAARTGAAYAEQTGRGTMLRLEWATGQWTGLAARARALVAETGEMPLIAADARLVLGLLALAKGEWGEVTAWASDAGSPARGDGAVPLSAAASGARIRLALARQDLDAAAAEAARAWARLRDKGVWVWAAELAPWAVEAAVRAGEPGTAQEMVAEFAAGLDGRQAPAAMAALDWSRAVLAEAAGETEAGAAHFRQASKGYAALPRPYEAALAEEGAGRCTLAAFGDATRDGPGAASAGLDELSCAAQRLDELGAVWDAARTRATLRAHRMDEQRPPGRPGYGDHLSPREREVALLAGTGLTNREIATTLHLSPRTVEQHVARAMRKLGAQCRKDLGTAGLANPRAAGTGLRRSGA